MGGLFLSVVLATHVVRGTAFFEMRDYAAPTASLLGAALLGAAVLILVEFVKGLGGKAGGTGELLSGKFGRATAWFSVNSTRLIVLTVVLGVIAAATQPMCVGSTYIQVVEMLCSQPEYRIVVMGSLLVYNLAYVLLPVVVLALVAGGAGSKRMVEFAGKNIGAVRLGLAVALAGLVIMVVYDLRWLYEG